MINDANHIILCFSLHYYLPWPLHWSVPKFNSLNIREWIFQFQSDKNIYHLYHFSWCLFLCILVTSSLSRLFFLNKWVIFSFFDFLNFTPWTCISFPIKRRIQLKINISIIMKEIKINGKISKKKKEKKLNLWLILSSMRRMLWIQIVLTLNWYGELKQKETVSKLRRKTYLGINQGNGERRKKPYRSWWDQHVQRTECEWGARISWT